MWELITNIILIISIITLAIFACLGLYQWITRKSFKKIDKQIRWMILPIVLVVITYLVFDKLLPVMFPNSMPTRPNGSGEPSFPLHARIDSYNHFLPCHNCPAEIHQKQNRPHYSRGFNDCTHFLKLHRTSLRKSSHPSRRNWCSYFRVCI